MSPTGHKTTRQMIALPKKMSLGIKRTREEAEAGHVWKREQPDVLRDLGNVPCCMGIDEAGR